MDNLDIERTYQHHVPFGTQIVRYQNIRDKAKEFALMVNSQCPESREKALALTNLQQAVFWMNASIAINEKEIK